MRTRTRPWLVITGLAVCVAAVVGRSQVREAVRASGMAPGPETAKQWSVAERVQQYGEVVRGRLAPDFARVGLPYPPAELVFVVLKAEKSLEVHAAGPGGGGFRFVRAYPVLAASGITGPKLQEGDRQVPEGFYRVESLNPNSLYHLSLRLNYPNEFDRRQADRVGRGRLGGDIMIHGDAVSIGCVAMGDPASEDLFVLAALTGPEHIRVLMAPRDLRVLPAPVPPPGAPDWLATLYKDLGTELRRYPLPAPAVPADPAPGT